MAQRSARPVGGGLTPGPSVRAGGAGRETGFGSGTEADARRHAGDATAPSPPAPAARPPGTGHSWPLTRRLRSALRRYGPGVGATAAVAVPAWWLGGRVALVSPPVLGIVLGMVVAAAIRPARVLWPGMGLAARQGLQLAVVLLGTGLSLRQVVATGLGSLPVMLGTLAAALGGAPLFGSVLGVDGDLRTLIGVGTGICGASAIAAASGVLEAADADIAYAVATVFVFNVAAVLIYPPLGRLLHFSQHAFGLWVGTAVNDTSSVVAAGYTFGQAAGNYAVIVKLARTTMIVPITLALAALRLRGSRTAATPALPWRRLVPWFIVWFLLASVANTLGAFGPALQHALARVALFLIVMALSAIGLTTEFGQMARTGLRPLLLGLLLWATVSLSSIGLQRLTGQ